MNPDHIPDPETSAMCRAGSWPVKFYLFLSADGCFVVKHEKRTHRTDPTKSMDQKTRLGYFWNVRLSLPEKVAARFAAFIVEYNNLSAVEIR